MTQSRPAYGRPGSLRCGVRDLVYRSSFLSVRLANVHPTASVRRGSILTPRTTVGAYTRINGPCIVRDLGEFIIGRWNAIGHSLHVITSNHPMNYANVVLKLDAHLGLLRTPDTRGGAAIGNACWVGDRVTLLAGARIGDGAVIGAGAVVTGPIPPFSVAMGVPARVARMRFDADMISLLEELKWWEWPIGRVERNRAFFAQDLTRTRLGDVPDLIVD